MTKVTKWVTTEFSGSSLTIIGAGETNNKLVITEVLHKESNILPLLDGLFLKSISHTTNGWDEVFDRLIDHLTDLLRSA